MHNPSLKKSGRPLNWPKLLFLALLGLGIFFRFFNLDRKVYWLDEAYTSLRVSGYTKTELVQQIFDGDETRAADLRKYQEPNPEKGLVDTIKSLAVEDSQHPPLYYVLARFWMQWFGDSVAVIRSLSAWISLLAFPCAYWLCQELFESSLTGWLAIGLIAVSPVHVIYAQEAREYSLWTVTVLLASAALLRAMRLNTLFSWAVYALTLTLSLYSFLFSGLVALGHGIYVAVSERWRWSQVTLAYLLASLAGLLAFAPWLVAIVTHWSQFNSTTSGTRNDQPLLSLINDWLGNCQRIFLDFDSDIAPVGLVFAILAGYAIDRLRRETPKRAGWFILSLTGSLALALVLPDVILGGQRSGRLRYLLPCCLGIQLAVARLLAMRIHSPQIQQRQRWRRIAVLLALSGTVSCAVSSQAEVWWNKSRTRSQEYPQIARIVNQATYPLVVSDSSSMSVMSLSHLLEPDVLLQLMDDSEIPKIEHSFGEIFLFNASESLQQNLDQTPTYEVEPIRKLKRLWRVEDVD